MNKTTSLKNKTSLSLEYSEPFSFEKTFYAPSRFKSGLEHFDGKNYFLSFRFAKENFGLKFYMKSKKLCLDVFSSNKISDSKLKDISEEVSFRFFFQRDFSKLHKDFSKDKFLKNALERNKGKHIVSIYNLYENLIISTFLQNATIQRTISMCDNMLNTYGSKIEFDGCTLRCLWDTETFNPTEDDLRKLKVGYRAKNILRIHNHFKESSVTERDLRALEVPKLVKELLKIYGVGKQTVFYLVLGQFHVTDYLKHIPLWERKILSYYLFKKELVDEKELVDWFNKRYKNWSGYAVSLTMEDVFHQHKLKPLPWMKKIMRED
jgi:3-methyladenine DNA glycosylase/8-oxoguanine DNA glycosylase